MAGGKRENVSRENEKRHAVQVEPLGTRRGGIGGSGNCMLSASEYCEISTNSQGRPEKPEQDWS